MTEYLFVYGTLMSTADHPMGVRLAREAVQLGEATVRGRLYDLGKWPGMVDSNARDAIVHGEVYALEHPAATFAWLDVYEGIHPQAPPLTEYLRTKRCVWLDDGRDIVAWVYLYQWDLTWAPAVPDGRWRAKPAAHHVPAEPWSAGAREGADGDATRQHAPAG